MDTNAQYDLSRMTRGWAVCASEARVVSPH